MISTGARARVRVGCPGLAFDVLGAAIWQVGLEGSIVNVPLIFNTTFFFSDSATTTRARRRNMSKGLNSISRRMMIETLEINSNGP